MPANDVTVRDYTGPCIDLILRCRIAEVTRGGRVETVAMPTSDATDKEIGTTNNTT